MWYGMVCLLVVVVVTCSLQWMIELATRPSHLRVMSLWEIQGCHLPLHDLRRHVSLMSEVCYVRIQMSPETTDELENTLPERGTYRMGSSAGCGIGCVAIVVANKTCLWGSAIFQERTCLPKEELWWEKDMNVVSCISLWFARKEQSEDEREVMVC